MLHLGLASLRQQRPSYLLSPFITTKKRETKIVSSCDIRLGSPRGPPPCDLRRNFPLSLDCDPAITPSICLAPAIPASRSCAREVKMEAQSHPTLQPARDLLPQSRTTMPSPNKSLPRQAAPCSQHDPAPARSPSLSAKESGKDHGFC